ncbi:MAG: protein kinase domain-containing protein [Sphingomonadaceae bacterium]
MALDWSVAVRRAQKLLQQEEAERTRTLAALTERDPALADFLRTHLQDTLDFSGFMATRANGSRETGHDHALVEPGAIIGPWRLEQLAGTGGMGQVWQARRDDGVYDQVAALKLLGSGSESIGQRFAAERQRLARMEHPNIARIIDGGSDDLGRPYMVMEYVEGDPIDRWCASRQADQRQRISLLTDLCAALAHAHARLVLHLDVKAGNVLVNREGRLRLIDFGIAALIDTGNGGTGGRALTLATAAPEQLTGGPLTVATDVFQVGMLAHLLLTGKLPERQADGAVTMDSGALDQTDLAAILRRATAAEPGHRYQSVDALGDDMRNWLADLPVSARDGGPWYHGKLLIRRHKAASAAIGIALAALLAGLGISLWQRDQAIAARNLALAEEERSDTIRESLYFLLAETGATDGQGTSALGLAAAAERIGARFDAAPTQYAAVLQALGELQFYLSDDVGALATLGRLLTKSDAIDPETLAQARYNAAQAHMRQGRAEDAGRLLTQAQEFWNTDRGRWAVRLTDSRLLEAQVLRQRDPSAAVALLEQTLDRHIRQQGADNQRAGVFYNNIGTSLVTLNRLEEAEAALNKADAVWRRTGLATGFDALNTLNNLASVQYLRGEMGLAEASFARAVSLREQLFGASAATAALLSNHGKALLGIDQPARALARFEQAEAMAVQYAGPASPLTVSIQLGRAEAMARSGSSGAVGVLDGTRKTIAALGDPLPLQAAFELAFGKVHLAEGREDPGLAAIRRAQELAAEAGPAAERIRSEAAALLAR